MSYYGKHYGPQHANPKPDTVDFIRIGSTVIGNRMTDPPMFYVGPSVNLSDWDEINKVLKKFMAAVEAAE